MKVKGIQLIRVFVLFFIISCEDDSNFKPLDGLPTTFELISNSENHQILTDLLQQTGLDEVLNEGIFTIFAPTDAAFAALDVNSLSTAELSQLLRYHVLQGNALSGNLSNTYFNTQATTTIQGNEVNLSLLVTLAENILINGSAQITEVDQEASNGIVHIIDSVLSIPNLKDLIEVDPNLSNLLTALSSENQPDYLSILATSIDVSPAPITLLAPSNDAFVNALGLLGFENVEEVEPAILTEIINLHILIETNQRQINFSNEGFETLGGNVSYDLERGIIVDANEREIAFTITDIQTTNGVMHVIEDVILIETDLQDPIDTTNQVSFTLNNDGNLAYFVTEITGNEEVTNLNENNSTWSFTVGTRYTITIINAESHPLEFRNEANETLLAQSETLLGLFEEDTNINFLAEENSISFTITQGLASQLSSYNCSNHLTMNGIILIE